MHDLNIPPGQEYLTVAEVAKILRVNKSTVLRKFSEMPGVIDIGTKETMHKRKHRMLRIPRSVLHRFLAERKCQ